MRYRLRTSVVEAVQYNGKFGISIPEWVAEAMDKGDLHYGEVNGYDKLLICTHEGIHKVGIGDYIIKESNGSLHPCGEELFLEIYEEMED